MKQSPQEKQPDSSLQLRKNLKYAIWIPTHLIKTLQDLINYIWKIFWVQDSENYTVILEDDTLIFDLSIIHDNDKIKLVRKDKLIKIAELAEKMRKWEKLIAEFSTDYLDFVKKHPFILSLPKEWKNLETVDLSTAQNNNNTEETKSGSVPKENQLSHIAIMPNLNQRITVFDYNNELFYETPAFQDFLSEAPKCNSREELQSKIKILASMRGFKVVQPCGEVLNQKNEFKNVFQWIKYGKSRKGSVHKKTGCPFTLIYKKTMGSDGYQLVKFRSAHNHPLDEVSDYSSTNPSIAQNYAKSIKQDDDYGADYSLAKSMNIKTDDWEGTRKDYKCKREDTDDYSLDGIASIESTDGKFSAKWMSGIPEMTDSMNQIKKFVNNENDEQIDLKSEAGTQNSEERAIEA